MRFGLQAADKTGAAIAEIDDVFVAQLAYDARERAVIDEATEFPYWDSLTTSRATNDASWLLVYEQSLGSRADHAGRPGPVRSLRSDFFQHLASHRVSFYDFAQSHPATEDEVPVEIERPLGYDEPDQEDDDDWLDTPRLDFSDDKFPDFWDSR